MHRKRYRNPFRAQIIDYLCRYDEIKEIGGCTALSIIGSIDRVMDRLFLEEDGPIKYKIILMLYIKKTHDVNGVTRECGIGKTTMFRWINEFIREVCVEAGLMK